ncbi:MAG: YihY/virulence factor BrkB family protein [Actinomycetota bacterium]|nr:YihY/virulence factor BrkB family protein [Actinomycetota bacterium]
MRDVPRFVAAPLIAARRFLDWPRVRWVRRLVGELSRECSSDRVTGLAAEVAFFVVLSVFPALLVMASALGFLDSIIGNQLAQEAQQRVISFLQRVLTQNAGDTIAVVRRLFTDQRTGLLTFSVLAGVWATARGFAAVMRALNIAYDVVEDRSWLRRQGIAVVLSLGTVIVSAVMLSMLVVGPLLGVGGSVAGAAGARALFATAWHWLRVPMVLLVLVAWSATVYHVGPRHAGRWRDDLPGAGLSALWWAVTALGFRYGVAVLAHGNRVFGALGGPLILLGLIYVLDLGLLVGGELNALVMRRRSGA